MNNPQYDNTNQGVLFKNHQQETDRHPMYKGSINVAGTDYWLSAWLNAMGPNTKSPGEKFLKLTVQPKEDRPQTYAQTTPPLAVDPDDIPF